MKEHPFRGSKAFAVTFDRNVGENLVLLHETKEQQNLFLHFPAPFNIPLTFATNCPAVIRGGKTSNPANSSRFLNRSSSRKPPSISIFSPGRLLRRYVAASRPEISEVYAPAINRSGGVSAIRSTATPISPAAATNIPSRSNVSL